MLINIYHNFGYLSSLHIYYRILKSTYNIQKGIISLESESDTLETASYNPNEYRTNKDILDRLFGKQKLSEY